jgi:hypothetical protein
MHPVRVKFQGKLRSFDFQKMLRVDSLFQIPSNQETQKKRFYEKSEL